MHPALPVTGQTRNWAPVAAGTLQPERTTVVAVASVPFRLFGSIGAPAFPSRSGSVRAAAHNAGDGKSAVTRNRAQRGEDNEHWTFPAVKHHGMFGSNRREDAFAQSSVRRRRRRYKRPMATSLTRATMVVEAKWGIKRSRGEHMNFLPTYRYLG